MLELKGIHSYYGLSHILLGVSLMVEPGEVVCLLGGNGAGKSTTMKSVMRLTAPKQGSIKFRWEEITVKQPYLLARKGIAHLHKVRQGPLTPKQVEGAQQVLLRAKGASAYSIIKKA